MGKTSVEVKERYNNKVYDQIPIRTRKDDLTREEIKAAAEADGMSLNTFIIQAIKEKMGRA